MEFVLCKKGKCVGEAVPTYFFLSLHIKRKEGVGAKDFNHVCKFLSFPTKRREEDRTFLGGKYMSVLLPPCVFTSPRGVPRCHV